MSTSINSRRRRHHWLPAMGVAAIVGVTAMMAAPKVAADGKSDDRIRDQILRLQTAASTLKILAGGIAVIDRIASREGTPVRSLADCVEAAGNDCAFNQLGVIDSLEWESNDEEICIWTCITILRDDDG